MLYSTKSEHQAVQIADSSSQCLTGPQHYPDNGLVSGTRGEVSRNQEEVQMNLTVEKRVKLGVHTAPQSVNTFATASVPGRPWCLFSEPESVSASSPFLLPRYGEHLGTLFLSLVERTETLSVSKEDIKERTETLSVSGEDIKERPDTLSGSREDNKERPGTLIAVNVLKLF
ncbi:hypothetical protein AVEN_13251-1 [Araneus ventricosus]|uniref:Uncharacterized protein n=1 Tax=Araneus ventricosus TaxID=182803 RepID=A0A4Y2DMY6_ARAVE|nr:hypothetical protein AVEN_13251-1 [Araneus ventricosus]